MAIRASPSASAPARRPTPSPTPVRRPTPTPTPVRPQGGASSAAAVERLQLLRTDLRKETLTPEEGFIASRLIGNTPTMEELLQTSGLPRPQALEIINGLLTKGILGRRAASVVRPPPGSAVEQTRDQERRERTKDNPLVSRFVRKHLKEALAGFRTAAALDARDADLVRLIEDTQGKVDQGEAERLFQEGVAAEGKKDFPVALERFRRAMELRPSNGRYVERVARKLLYQEEAFTEAKKLADRAVQLQPNDADARATLARAYLQAGLKGKAKKELETVLQLNKEHKFAKSQMKRLRWWSGA
jgi:tetratricopeptide (TPR) repeat protein